MAVVDWNPLLDPLRGKELGTVFQTGRWASVIKSKQSGQGQQLRPLKASKASLQHAATLWAQLSPADQAAWNAARPDFPTVDRYNAPVLSSPFQLFMRAIAPLAPDRQQFLTVPGSVFTGPLPPGPGLTYDGSVLSFKTMEAPPGQNFNTALFCTRPAPASTYFAKPSFRQVAFLDDYTGLVSSNVTAQYTALFGDIVEGSQLFWCVKTWKEGTPELLDETCGILFIQPYIQYAIRYLSNANGVLSRRFYYDGPGTPVCTHKGVDVGAPSVISLYVWEFAIPFDGTTDQEVLLIVDNDLSVYRTNPNWLNLPTEITYIDVSRLPSATNPDGFQISSNNFRTLILPSTSQSFLWTISGGGAAGLYPVDEPVTITGSGTYTAMRFNNFTRAVVDIASIEFAGTFRWGRESNTTAISNSANRVILPISNGNSFTDFFIGAVYAQDIIDLSGWTGAFSGSFAIVNQGSPAGPFTVITLPPDIQAVESLYIGNSRNLATQTLVVNNGTGLLTSLRIYRNVLNSASQRLIIDLTLCKFAELIEFTGFGADYAAWQVILPASNNENFTRFVYSTVLDSITGVLDLATIFTGNFSGVFALGALNNHVSVTLPADMLGVTSFAINSMFHLTSAIDLPATGVPITSLFVYRSDAGGVDPSKVLDLSLNDYSESFQVYTFADNRPPNWYSVLLPALNTADFSAFQFANIYNMPTIDFSGWTGNITLPGNRDLVMWGLSQTTTVLLGFASITSRNMILRNSPLLNQSFDLGTQIVPRGIFDISMCGLSTANIDSMVNKISVNAASFLSGVRFNFSRSRLITANTQNYGTNDVPSAASVTTMNALFASDGLRFNYWDGTDNVPV